MKITLSKSQWEFIGKKAGWIKIARDGKYEFSIYRKTEPDETGEDPNYIYKVLLGKEDRKEEWQLIDVIVEADYERGERETFYNPGSPSGWIIESVTDVELNRDITARVNDDDIANVLDD